MSNDATHDITAYNVVIALHRLTGFADGDAFTVTSASDRASMLIGNYGLGAWVKMHNKAATGTFSLLSSSDDNTTLQALLDADEVTVGGILYPLVILQTNGLYVASASIRLTRQPDVARGVSVPTTVWNWGTTRMYTAQGGSIPTQLVQSVADAQALLASATPAPQPS